MNRFAAAVVSPFVFTMGLAHAYRDDLPADPVRDCASPVLSVSNEYRDQCALAAIERACASGDPAMLTAEVARILGVTGVQVNKAAGRHTLASLERGDLCQRPESERRLVLGASRQAKKVPSEAAQEWLLRELGGAAGVIDPGAVALALEQRDIILNEPRAKRAGLPALPSAWTNLTGYNQSPGRINHILFTSGTGNDILAGADGGGIWRTSNGGALWTPVNDFLGSLSITNFAKATTDAATIYAGTNARGSHGFFPFGIVKSTDGGNSWLQLPNTDPAVQADFKYVQRIAVHPTNAMTVLAATEGGAYQTIDGGGTWTKVGPTTRAYYVAFHPTDGNRRAVGYNDGTVRFTTNGDLAGAGALTSTVLAGARHTKLAYAPSDPSRMYALVTDASLNTTRLFMSVTGGNAWTEVSAAPLVSNGTFYNQGYLSYTGGLWVDPLNANRVAVFEGWAAFTTDITAAPAVWRRIASGWTDYHGIVEHPAYDGVGNRTVFFMDDGGLYRVGIVDSLDVIAQFSRIETGLTVTQVYSVAASGGNPIMGAQDVGPKVHRLDASIPADPVKWRFLRRPVGDALCSGCNWIGDGMTVAASRTNSAVLYGSRQYLDLFRSTDGGATATSLAYLSTLTEGGGASPSNTNAAFLAPFVLDPSNQSRMLAGGQSLWRTNDVDTGSPPTWTSIRAPMAEPACGGYMAPVTVIAIAPSNPDIVWIAHECAGRLFKSVNATQPVPTWTAVTTMPALANNRSKGSITIDPTDPNIVWVGLGQYQASTLFKTTDGGATAGGWSTVAGLPGAPVYTLLQHPASSSWLYAATGVGLFASADGGATWSTSNEGPANIIVRSMAWNGSGVSPELLLATYGRGVFKATVTFGVTPDGTPDAFSFPSQSVASGSVPVSASTTITGINIAVSISVTGGEYSIGCTGSFTAVTGTISNGQSVCVRHAAANTSNTSRTTTLTVGGVAGTFTSTTFAILIVSDDIPNAFSFASQTGVSLGSTVTSASATISGINVASSVTVSNGTYSVGCGATFTSAPGTISNGQTICVRHTSAGTTGASTTTTLTIGGVSGTFTSTTFVFVVLDGTPNAFVFAPRSDVAPGSIVVTPAVTITGINVPVDVTVANGEYSVGCNGTFTSAAGSITDGQTICVRHVAASAASTARTTTLVVGGFSAIFTSTTAAAVVLPDPARLANISTRAQVLTGNDVMIGGFVIGGSANKTVVVRARGPSLVPFGITNALANPSLQLVQSSDQSLIAVNDDWGTAPNAAAVIASGFAPGSALEAAILVALPPGAYTAIVSGVGGGTGVGIIEVFEVDQPQVPLVNISTRGQVLTGNDVMIGGFVIQGSGPQTVVVRARGPSLIPFGINNALANPMLQLVRSSDQLPVGFNDDWALAGNAAALFATGLAPSNAAEAAILITLDPGAYTAIVTSAGGATGVGIVEVFAQ